MRTLVVSIGQLTSVAFLWINLVGCEPRNQFIAPPPPKVTVAYPVSEPVVEYFETTGRTRSMANIEIRARVGGYLQEIHFKDGDRVSKGDLLFTIDKAPYEAAVASAAANVAKALAQLQLADQQLTRTRSLAQNNAATESALDVQLAEKASREADLAAAEAALQEAQLNLNYTEIVAPFDGRIGRHLVDVGNLVLQGQTILGTLESVDPIHAYFELSESDLLRFMEMIRAGSLQFNEANPPEVELSLGGASDFAYKGKLDFIAFGVDPSTGTTERRAVFPNPNGELVPGLFVRVRVALGEPKEQLMVEDRAIGSDQRGEYVLVVNDKNVVEQRPVKPGRLFGNFRAIISGVTAQDRIVINGLQRARPGSTVEPEMGVMGAPEQPPQKSTPPDADAIEKGKTPVPEGGVKATDSKG